MSGLYEENNSSVILNKLCVLIQHFSILLCRPAYGGKFCEGSSRSYKLCNTEDCPPNTTDYRAQQCAEFNSKQFRGWYYTWRPYTRVDGKTIVPLKQGSPKCCLCIKFNGACQKKQENKKNCNIKREIFWEMRLLPTSHVMTVNIWPRWLFSFLPDQDVCKLYCFAEGYDFFFALASKVKDGTLCSQDSSNVCIDGLCEVNLLNVKQ